MDLKFLTARSPIRLLEKGLHGGLGDGNLGLVLAGHGVGKTAFLVGVALDDLLQGRPVLHVALDQTVSHMRAHYDTVFDDLASHAHLEDEAVVHAEVDRLRRIRAYPPDGFDAAKLREAIKVEEEAAARPALVVLEGWDAPRIAADQVEELASLARELDIEVWVSVACPDEQVAGLPGVLDGVKDAFAVILALEPQDGEVRLRALKDHDSPDVEALHVALDPKSLLLRRS
jgi:hypothetical protein